MPEHFATFDAYCCGHDIVSKPVLECKILEHFIGRHRNQGLCRRCASGCWVGCPFGLAALRVAGSGFPQRQRINLGAKEAQIGVQLRCHLKLIGAYVHHRESNDVQRAALSDLVDNLQSKHVVLQSDWKEMETLPIVPTPRGKCFTRRLAWT